MPGTICTSSHRSAPKLSRICFVLCTRTGAVRYSHCVMRRPYSLASVYAVTIATPLHVVTGKGGTRKPTVAAALATALAQSGQRVLRCEIEASQGIVQLFDVPPLPYDARGIAM